MSFFSRFYDFEKFPGIPREKFPNSQFFPFPWEKNLGGKTETLYLRLLTCMCRLIRSMSGGGPVTKPNLIPLLSTLEKLSKRKTRPSVSKERKLEGRLGRYCKKK